MSIKGTRPGKQSQGTLNRQERRKPTLRDIPIGTIIEDEVVIEPPNINKMRKPELIEYAVSLGVPATMKMTVKEIKAALGE